MTSAQTKSQNVAAPAFARPIADFSSVEKRALLTELLQKKAIESQPYRPLSDNQQGIWFLSQFAPESSIYNVSVAGLIRSEVDSEGFRRAFQALVDRHPSLRTVFTVRDGKPAQRTLERQPADFDEVDASTWSDDALKGRLDAETQRSFDLERGPVMRASLFTRSIREHVLLLVIHHIAVDFWSLAMIMNELGALYPGKSQDRTAVLPPLGLRYTDFVRWQADLLAGPEGERLWGYWKKQLAGPLPVLNLPTDRPRPPIQLFRGAHHDFTLNERLTERLRGLAKTEGATLYMVLLTVFELTLFYHSGQDDILVASPMVGRSRVEFESMVGLFANPVVLRANMAGNPTFKELLARVRQTVVAALDHQDYPTLRLVQRLRPPRDLSRPPLCQTMFVLDKPHRTIEQAAPSFARGETGFRMDLGGFEMESIPLERRAATLDLVMLIIETTGSLSASIRFNTDLFDASTIVRMAEHFQTLVESILDDTGAAIGDLEMLTSAERRQLLVDFNDTKTEYDGGECVHQLFEQQVSRTPDSVAVMFEGQQLTYAQLNARANQLARHLQALGVGPETLVAICMERCPEMAVAVLGILKAGGAFLPLDPTYPAERLAFMIDDARPRVILTKGSLPGGLIECGTLIVAFDSDWGAIARESEENPAVGANAGNLAYVIYTSGSTGRPKGVMCEHGGLANYLRWVGDGPLGDLELSVPLTTRLTFDMCLKQLFPPLLRGGALWMLPEEILADPVALLSALATRTKTGFNCVPSLWKAILDAIESGRATAPEHGLTHLFFGGEPLGKDLVGRTLRALPHLQIWNIYGPTEATANASATRIAEGDEVTIGRPIANATIYILNAFLRPVAIGVQGDLYIGGAGVARGYLNRPELTAERFVADPFSAQSGARMYKTGDLARYRPDGNIEFLGRADQQVKIRGFRIELGEIEAALARHPDVREAVVVTHEAAADEDPAFVRAERQLVAYVVAGQEPGPTTSELRTFLKEKLPEYMVPTVFVTLAALPLLPNGKIDRRALRAPDRSRPDLDEAFTAPRNATEELLVGIWAELLDVKGIGIHDNFFDLGGHSLLATQLVSRVRESFRVEIPLRRLFEAPTVAGLAYGIEAARTVGQNPLAPPIVPVPRDGDLALSFAQQRLWFFDQLEPGHTAYNIPAAVRLKGPLNLPALERSLNEIVKRHESLRTTFEELDGRPRQVIAPALTIALPVVDLRHLPPIEREIEVRRLATAEAQRSFDLAKGPLIRGSVLRLTDREQVGLLTMHHIVSDGWSTGILVRELATLYVAFCAGGSSPLPELPIQYADFAQWQRQWLQGEILETQIAYWKERLAGAPAATDLPLDRARPAMQTFRGAHRSAALSQAVREGIGILSRREGATEFMAYLAAFKILLARYTGSDDSIVGTPVANRNRLETEGLIGFFVNALVLRTDLSGDPSFREVLQRVRETCLGAYSHQDVPFDRLVEELHVTRDLSRNPLFQTMFVLHNASLRAIELSGFDLSPVEGDSETAHFDLTLQIADTGQGLTASFIYNTDLFEADTIARMLSGFQLLLEALIADPERRMSRLPIATEAERHQLLVEWNGTRSDWPWDLCVHQVIEAKVVHTPDAIALVCGADQLTYAELNRRANQLAHRLRSLGVGPEVLVGMCLERSVDAIIGLLGILKAGGAYLPLDPAYPKERLQFMLDDAKAKVLVTRAGLAAGLADTGAEIICFDADADSLARESEDNPGSSAGLDNLAYAIYTSGSTGQPKGVLVSHRAIADHCLNAQSCYRLDSSDIVLQFASLSFDVSLEEILPTLMAGARLVIMGPELWPPADFHHKIDAFGLSVLNLPTAYWQELAHEWADLPELIPNIRPRLIVVGGEAMSPQALKVWRRSPVNAIRLVNAYGPTEATITATTFDVPFEAGETEHSERVPIGHPLANRTVYILDRYGQPVPIGVRGILHIGGEGLARGYLNRSDLTAEKFVTDPFSARPGARMYITGDLARYRADGAIEFLGRSDDQVKIRGFRIELGEIEAVIGHHPAVREVAVLAREDPRGEKRLVAYVVADATIDELRGFLLGKLPEYMIPQTFMLLDALPVAPNGKVDRSALPTPNRSRAESERVFVAPRDDLERRLVQIWEEVLGTQPIGVTDNFFELGGHSLLAVRLFALIEKRLGRKLPLTAVFQGATVEHLAALLRRQPVAGLHSVLVAIQPGGSKRPLFLVHPAGGQVFPYIHLARHLGSDQPCYGLQSKGLEEGQEPDTRIEDMAAHYIQALRTVQPKGPYLLGGWSMGGVVAFEMAQQLRALGERVALLALIDGRIPTSEESFPEGDAEALALVERYFGVSFGSMDSLTALPEDEQLAFVLEQAKSAGLVPAELDVSEARRFVKVLRNDLQATRNYGLRRFPGRVTFFRASEIMAESATDPTMGWGDWADEGVELHRVPGNHANLMYEPHVETLAATLTACLAAARASEGELDAANAIGKTDR